MWHSPSRALPPGLPTPPTMVREWGSRGPEEAYERQIIFYLVTTERSERFACSRHQKPNGGGPLLRFRSHFPDIRVPRSRHVSLLPPALLLRLQTNPLLRLRRSDRSTVVAGGDIACLLAPEKSLILGIPREDSTGRVTRSEIAVTITGFRENERGRSPVGQDQSFSNPPDRMLYPRGDSSVGTAGVGEGGEAGGERVLRKAKEGERRKGSLIRSRGEPGPRFLRDSFASRRLAGI